MRISTNSIMRNYRTHLGKSTVRMNESRDRVLTERKFTKASFLMKLSQMREWNSGENIVVNVPSTVSIEKPQS